jgi:hypothetical protein
MIPGGKSRLGTSVVAVEQIGRRVTAFMYHKLAPPGKEFQWPGHRASPWPSPPCFLHYSGGISSPFREDHKHHVFKGFRVALNVMEAEGIWETIASEVLAEAPYFRVHGSTLPCYDARPAPSLAARLGTTPRHRLSELQSGRIAFGVAPVPGAMQSRRPVLCCCQVDRLRIQVILPDAGLGELERVRIVRRDGTFNDDRSSWRGQSSRSGGFSSPYAAAVAATFCQI